MLLHQVVEEINRLEDVYCEDCPIKQDLRSRKGKTAAHQFCITGCSVGKELQQMGSKLYQTT